MYSGSQDKDWKEQRMLTRFLILLLFIPSFAIAQMRHSDLLDMPDWGGVCRDHDARYRIKNKTDDVDWTDLTDDGTFTDGGYCTYDEDNDRIVCTSETGEILEEQIEDVAGGMVTGNTETRITVTYQDGDGTTDYVVDDMNDDNPDDDSEVPDNITVNPINATTESAIETVVDLQDLQGAVTDGQVPDDITITESDPQVGAVTDNLVCEGDGDSVECDLTTTGTGSVVFSSSPSLTGVVSMGGSIGFLEILEPSTPPANTLKIYAEDIKGFSFFKYLDSTGMKREIIRDSMILVKNVKGSTIAANRIVYATGSEDNVPTIDLAKADSVDTMPAIGVTIESIANGAYGRVMQVGLLENINTDALAESDILYVSDATAGIPITTAPITPSLTQEIGTVLVSHETTGAIQIVARGVTGDEYGTAQNEFRIGDGGAGSKILSFNADTDGTITWDETKFDFGAHDIETSGTITGDFIGNVTGDCSGSSGSCTGNSATATALAANGANCDAGNAPLGVDASGAVEGCFDVCTQAEHDAEDECSEISGCLTTIDISDNTNLTAGDHITLTDDDLDIDDVFIFNNADDATTGWLTVAGLTSTDDVNIATGKDIRIGTTQWNSGDTIDGEQIKDDTIDNDSIDWSDMTDLTTDGAVSWGNVAEGELTDSCIVSADIKDDTIDSADYNADSIDNEHINWADIDYLNDEGDFADDSVQADEIDTINCGRSMTWDATNDEVDADAELYTDTKCIIVETPTDADNFIMFYAKTAITITDINCICEDATSVVIDIQECDSAGDNCATVDATITCDVDGAEDDGSFSNGAIDATDWLRLDIGTVTGTPGHVTVCVTFTWDD